jgi:PAS domain S-box-containing protein
LSPFEHILIVDDNPDDRALIYREVRTEEPAAIVSEARNYDEFHDQISDRHIDLVITDYQLNWTSGIEVLKLVKKYQPDCSVIMFTASGSEEVAVTAMKNGLQDYILKSPANLERLRTSIRQSFVQSQQRKALEAAQNRYRELFQGIPIGLYQTSPDGRFMEVNQAMVKMLGYPDAESLMLVETNDLYVHKDDYSQWRRRSNELGEVRGLEVEMWRYDRSVIWVEINGKPVYKEGVFQYNEGSLQDITDRVNAVRELQSTASHAAQLAKRNAELYAQLQKHSKHLEDMIGERTRELKREVQIRKKSEEDLLISQSSYKAVVDRVREAICKLDEDGIIRFINPAWEQITGYDISSSLGKEFSSFFDEDTIVDINLNLKEFYTSASNQIQMLVPFTTRDKQTRWIEIYFDADKNLAEDVIGLFVMIFDVTDRKLANDEISRAYAKEKELSELRAQFVSMTSHEFRTPLASIMTSSELLQHYGHNWPREKNEVHHSRIQSSVKQIISMMDDVLIIGKSDAGKLVCEKHPENPVEMTQTILDEIALNSKQSHAIVFDFSDTVMTTWLDRKLYRQIVSNLVTNALKYSSKGSTVSVKLNLIDDELQLKITDKGIGIPDSDREQMFQAFFRARNVGDTPGTGLGLPIVKRSVDAHGGTISIDSSENVGTTVTITLDVRKSEN